MDIPLEEKHLDAMTGENPVTAALREAGFPNPRIAATRITTSETIQWTIAGPLADWLERRQHGEPVRIGTLRLDLVTASITISEVPPSWARVTEFHEAPSHHIKFQYEIFCEDGAVKGLAQHGLDFDEERQRLANGEKIVIEFQGMYPVNPGKTVTWQQYDQQGDPRRSCMCDYCRAYRSAGGRFRRPGSRLLRNEGPENED